MYGQVSENCVGTQRVREPPYLLAVSVQETARVDVDRILSD